MSGNPYWNVLSLEPLTDEQNKKLIEGFNQIYLDCDNTDGIRGLSEFDPSIQPDLEQEAE